MIMKLEFKLPHRKLKDKGKREKENLYEILST